MEEAKFYFDPKGATEQSEHRKTGSALGFYSHSGGICTLSALTEVWPQNLNWFAKIGAWEMNEEREREKSPWLKGKGAAPGLQIPYLQREFFV